MNQSDSHDQKSQNSRWATSLASGLLGVSLCCFSALGFFQLRSASISGLKSPADFPIANFYLLMFTPDSGAGNLAQIASNAQSAIVMTFLAGLLLLVIAVVSFVRSDK